MAVDNQANQTIQSITTGPTRSPGDPFGEKDKTQILNMIRLGFSLTEAAALMGVDRSTVYRARKKDEWFGRNLQRARELAKMEPIQTLVNAARKSWRAALKLLENRDKQQEQETNKKQTHRRLNELENEIRQLRRQVEQQPRTRSSGAIPGNRLPSPHEKNGAGHGG